LFYFLINLTQTYIRAGSYEARDYASGKRNLCTRDAC